MNIEIQFKAVSQEKLEQDMASMLRKCGWLCTRGGEWLGLKQVRARYNISKSST
jgi:hypothetical protein